MLISFDCLKNLKKERKKQSVYFRKRRSVIPPKEMVTDGKCVFGTFDREFETIDLLKIKNLTLVPSFLNKLKLTLWEATEVHFQEGVLLAVCCDMGIFGQILNGMMGIGEDKDLLL